MVLFLSFISTWCHPQTVQPPQTRRLQLIPNKCYRGLFFLQTFPKRIHNKHSQNWDKGLSYGWFSLHTLSLGLLHRTVRQQSTGWHTARPQTGECWYTWRNKQGKTAHFLGGSQNKLGFRSQILLEYINKSSWIYGESVKWKKKTFKRKKEIVDVHQGPSLPVSLSFDFQVSILLNQVV